MLVSLAEVYGEGTVISIAIYSWLMIFRHIQTTWPSCGSCSKVDIHAYNLKLVSMS